MSAKKDEYAKKLQQAQTVLTMIADDNTTPRNIRRAAKQAADMLLDGAISIAAASLVLHSISDMARGFAVLFTGLAILMVIITPLIFVMPRAPEAMKVVTGTNEPGQV